MCRACWALVPSEIQGAVYATFKRRSKSVDASWGPWWRAHSRAIAANAKERGIFTDDYATAYLERAEARAKQFEAKKEKSES